MREGWLVGVEDGCYVVYERTDGVEDGDPAVGARIGAGPTLADALDDADRYERLQAIAGRRAEQAERDRIASMSCEEREAYMAQQKRERDHAVQLAEIMRVTLPKLLLVKR